VLCSILLSINVIAISFSDQRVMIPAKGYTNFFVLLFVFITFYTMLIRGIGFEMLGSSKSGGMFYIKLFSILLLFVFLPKIKTSDRFISALFFAYFISCVLPFLADVLFMIFGGETIIHKIIPGSTTIKFYAESEGSLFRMQSAASVAEYIVVLMLAYKPPFNEAGKLSLKFGNIAIFIAALILIGLSGHRITLVGITLLLIFYYYNSFGKKKLIKPLLIGGLAAIAICVFAILRFENLPPNFQRTFSFLPFTPTNEVTLNAADSLNFRLLMAAKAVIMLPDYYLIGKGFAFFNYPVDTTDYFGIIDFFAEIGVFHNGLLGLLINLGIPGLVVGVALIFSLIKFTGKKVLFKGPTGLDNLMLVLKSKILVSVIYFFFLYGDVQSNFMEIIILGILYKIIHSYTNGKVKGLVNEGAL